MLILLGVLFTSGYAQAESSAESRSNAVLLFDEGEKLFAAGRYADACPKYAESYRLDPQIGALLHVAECFEKTGKLASAWGSWREAEELAAKNGDDRADLARTRATALEPRLSRLTITVDARARLEGLTVKRDAVPVAAPLWDTAAPVDPGRHQIEASAPGHRPWTTEVTVSTEGQALRVDIPVLEPAPAELVTPSGANAAPPDHAPDASQAKGPSAKRVAGYIVLGVGSASLITAGVLGAKAIQQHSLYEDRCSGGKTCTSEYQDYYDTYQTNQTLAFVAAGVGVVGVGVGLYLLLSGDSSPSTDQAFVRPWVGLSAVGATGAF